jgi:anthranilate synthase
MTLLDNAAPAERFTTAGGIAITRRRQSLPASTALLNLAQRLDRRRGALLSSSFEYPGRYTRWDIGFTDPPLEVSAAGETLRVRALNARGCCLLPAIATRLAACEAWALEERGEDALAGRILADTRPLPEEERTRRRSLFTVLRALIGLFRSEADAHLGLYGAFGYDLAFALEPMPLQRERPADQRDLLLYLPDELLIVDHRREVAERISYDFALGAVSTEGLARDGEDAPFRPAATNEGEATSDHEAGAYEAAVEAVRNACRRGDLFECVLSQTLSRPTALPPSELFRRLKERNPAPYGALLNLGEGEFLVAASPEMFVRVQGRRVETCPISGTIARGRDALGDAAQILKLLNSAKDEAELTMCTDVDRNDKARVCRPGSVQVTGRRQVELYSRLIHTVDHVVGELAPGFDALDAFLTHTWAVTVTGAPKRRAMRMIEETERSSRRWYGGALGFLGFNGSLNTGLTLRTLRLKDGLAEARVGATLLYDSDPQAEEAECRVKVAALLSALEEPAASAETPPVRPRPGAGKRVLLVDHQDSFVLTLADYFRQTGAEVTTLRPEPALARLAETPPDLLVLSPGPGVPGDFPIAATLTRALALDVPVFGVCLGLQGIVEFFGGRLATLGQPVHGKPSAVRHDGRGLFAGLPNPLATGRYHSLHAVGHSLPDGLAITARSEDGTIMAIAHERLPILATQFHPESILSLEGGAGLRLIGNALTLLTARKAALEPGRA